MKSSPKRFLSYDEIFNARGNAYHEAMRLVPMARKNEFETGGGYLADHLLEGLKLHYIAIDPAEGFARKMEGLRAEWHLAPLTNLPLETGSVDVLLSVAGLHHPENRIAVFKEMRRVLRKGGRLGILEVTKGHYDAFLNVFVDRHNSMGHDGNFIDDQFSADLREAGFEITKDELQRYTWDLPTSI